MAKTEDRKKALDAEISRAMMTDFERVGHGFITYWKQIAAVAVGLAVLIFGDQLGRGAPAQGGAPGPRGARRRGDRGKRLRRR
jgi:hypothetical protein